MITQEDLEKWQSLRDAKRITDTFLNDRETYPDRDFYLRRGVCVGIGKRIKEEYAALVCLAEECDQTYSSEVSIRLSRNGNPGPDGEIRFSSGIPSCKVQITCSNEGPEEARMREQHANKQTTSKLGSPSVLFQERLQGIIEAIKKKNNKYYQDTDTLLVVDHTAHFQYLHGLHERVCDAISNGPKSPYKRIYIDYGGDLKQAK
ncbi:MAG: hypothetical protein ACLPVO_05820 [Desulfomonilaceae bacterium]